MNIYKRITLTEIKNKLGLKNENILEIKGSEICNNGCYIRVTDICTEIHSGLALQSISIYKLVKYTDGGFRPIYYDYKERITLYLNKKILDEHLF